MGYIRTGNLKIGTYLYRENRFVVFVKLEGSEYRCYLPNPGRMIDLLHENSSKLVFIPTQTGSNRKTDGTVIGIKQGESVINLDTMMFSQLIPAEINNNVLPLFDTWSIKSQEKTIGNHRFDFIMEIENREIIVEVKSTTRVVEGIACFPDAVSKRATDHILALHDLSKQGKQTMVIFTVYQDAEGFQPCASIDPDFASNFAKVRDTVRMIALQIKGKFVNNNSIEYKITGTIPIIK